MTAALEVGQTVRVRNGGTKDGYLVTVLEVHDDPNLSVTVTWWDTFHDEQRTGAFFADELEPIDLGAGLTVRQAVEHAHATGASFAEVARAWIDPALIPAVLAAADGALARDEHGKVRAVSLALPGSHGAILATADEVREWLRQADGDPATAAEALTRAILTTTEGA